MALFEDLWNWAWVQYYYGKPNFQVEQFATTAQSIPSGSATLVNFDSTNLDSWSGFNLATDTYTVPVAGWWRFTSQVSWSGNGTGQRYSALHQNGSLVTTAICTRRANTGTISTNVDSLVQCVVGDTITLFAYQDSGSAQPIFNNSTYTTLFSGIWVHS